jgi:potassium-dependent mechanosensitive channel
MIPDGMRQVWRLLAGVMLACALLVSASAADREDLIPDQRQQLSALRAKADATRSKIADAAGDDAKLVQVRTELDGLVKSALDVAVAFRPRLNEINKRLTDLGPVPTDASVTEPDEVVAERKRLTSEKAAINVTLGETEDLSVAISKNIDDIAERRRNLFADDLAKRVDVTSVFSTATVDESSAEAAALGKIVKSWFSFVTRFKLNSMLGACFFALLSAVIMFIGGRRLFGSFYSADPDVTEPSYLSRLSVAFWSTLIPSASFAVFLAVTYFLFDYFKVLRTDIRDLMWSAFSMSAVVFFIYRLARAVLSPGLRSWRLVHVEAKPAQFLVYLFTATAFVTGLDGFLAVVNETLGSPLSLTIAKSFGATVLVGLLVVMISLVRPSGKSVIKSPFDRTSRTTLFLLGLLPLIAAGLGYIGLARFVTQQIVITGALISTMYLGFQSARSLQAEGAFANSGFGQMLGRRFGFGDTALDRIGVLISLLVNLLVVAIGIPLILLQWRFRWEDISAWIYKAVNGFTIGSVTISLVGVLTGIFAFAVVLVLTRWFQRWLDGNILSRGKIDSGVRHSIRTAFGYAGMAIAGLIGISAAGIDLSSLALVAGALSLGIGFGLQNIVSNFVSGLILLAERPFKVGDWIEAGTTAGFVKKISVRATEVETFHRQTVILPNSVLINAAVGNWTHRNKLGRVDIPVGVAYTTDPARLREILLEIARAHPLVLKTPEPFVFFKAFGNPTLDFELRVHLGDITQITPVQNDLRFSIFSRLKAAGIEIPFPRDNITYPPAQPVVQPDTVVMEEPADFLAATAQKPKPVKS